MQTPYRLILEPSLLPCCRTASEIVAWCVLLHCTSQAPVFSSEKWRHCLLSVGPLPNCHRLWSCNFVSETTVLQCQLLVNANHFALTLGVSLQLSTHVDLLCHPSWELGVSTCVPFCSVHSAARRTFYLAAHYHVSPWCQLSSSVYPGKKWAPLLLQIPKKQHQ